MKQAVIAFTTTGPSPKDGHRFSEIVVVEVGDEAHGSPPTRFALTDEKQKFASVLPRLKSIVGDAAIVVHNAGKWRRFLRAELRTVKRHGAGRWLKDVIDVGAWAHQRFPRQRRDVGAIAGRLGICVSADLTGLALEVELLRQIAARMNTPVEPVAPESSNKAKPEAEAATKGASSATTSPAVVPELRVGMSLAEKLDWFWRQISVKLK